jgi:hypothetical protein
MRHLRLFLLIAIAAQLPFAAVHAALRTYLAGGYSVDAGFTSDQASVMVGQPFWVSLSLTNSGKSPIVMVASTTPEQFPALVTIIDSLGKVVYSPLQGASFNGLVQYETVDPGTNAAAERTLVTPTAASLHPGTYTIICERSIGLLAGAQGDPKDATIVDIVDTFPLVVTRYDRNRMGQVIDQFGQASLSQSGDQAIESVESLLKIDDPRTIPWYAKIIRTPYSDEIKLAIAGVSQYATVDAAQALAPALGTDLDEKDSSASDALAAMEASAGANKEALMEAIRLPLLDELVSTSPATRAIAVNALGATKDDDVLQPLIAALSDSSPVVRNAAALAIGNLGDVDGAPPLKAGLDSPDQDFHLACAKGLVALKLPFDASWVLPIACTYSLQNQADPIQALQLIVGNAPNYAGVEIASGLHFDDPSPANPYNYWFLYELDSCSGAPHLSSQWQMDSDPTCPQSLIDKNRAILANVQQWLAATTLH